MKAGWISTIVFGLVMGSAQAQPMNSHAGGLTEGSFTLVKHDHHHHRHHGHHGWGHSGFGLFFNPSDSYIYDDDYPVIVRRSPPIVPGCAYDPDGDVYTCEGDKRRVCTVGRDGIERCKWRAVR